MFCEFCGSGPDCAVCGRNETATKTVRNMLGCTIVTVETPEMRAHLIVRGHFLTSMPVYAAATRECRSVTRIK